MSARMEQCHPTRESDKLRIRQVYNNALTTRLKEYSKAVDLQIGIVTYNVAGALPDVSRCQQLLQMEKSYDILAVTLQEVDMTPWAVALEVTEYGPLWAGCITKALAAFGQYVKVFEQQLVGLVLLLYVKRGLHTEIHRLQSAHFRSGAFWYVTTKGGIVVRFTLYGRRFLFCAQHLTPHPGELKQRYEEYRMSIATAQFPVSIWVDDPVDRTLPCFHPLRMALHPSEESDSLLSPTYSSPSGGLHVDSSMGDYCFWFGDLNYRVEMDYDDAIQAISVGNLQPLLEKDQLLNGRHRRQCFLGFQESKLDFPPTYKFKKGTAEYESGFRRRTPSWTDRILWTCPFMQFPADLESESTSSELHSVTSETAEEHHVNGLQDSSESGSSVPHANGIVVKPADVDRVKQSVSNHQTAKVDDPTSSSSFTAKPSPDSLPAGAISKLDIPVLKSPMDPDMWMEQTHYQSVPLHDSDHLPVTAGFTVRCREVNLEKLEALLNEITKQQFGVEEALLLSTHTEDRRLGDFEREDEAECPNSCTMM